MTDTKKLIEEAFKKHDSPMWGEDDVARDAAIRWHMRGFNDALEAAEEALAPTGDEREAVDRIVFDLLGDTFSDAATERLTGDLLVRLHAAGFRRPEVSPTGHRTSLKERLGGKDGDELCPECHGELTSWYCEACGNTGLVRASEREGETASEVPQSRAYPCTPAIAGISDGPNADCSEHGALQGEPSDRLIDARGRAGVVAEEPEWEYRIEDDTTIAYSRSKSRADRALMKGARVWQRTPERKASAWVPMKQEGESRG